MPSVGVTNFNPGLNSSAQPATIAPVSATTDVFGAPTGPLVANNQSLGITGAQLLGGTIPTATQMANIIANGAATAGNAMLTTAQSAPVVRAAGNQYSYVLAQWGCPIGLASTGTVAADGTFTNTALATTYSGGIWMYFPAGAINDPDVGSAAGFYWCVFSSTTAGQVKKNYLASLGTPKPPAVVGANAVGSAAGYTGTTAAINIFSGLTLAANSVGPNGILQFRAVLSHTNNGNAKLVQLQGNGAAYSSSFSLAGSSAREITANLTNMGVANRQVQYNAVATIASFFTIDTSIDQALTIVLTRVVDTDATVLNAGTLSLTYAA